MHGSRTKLLISRLLDRHLFNFIMQLFVSIVYKQYLLLIKIVLTIRYLAVKIYFYTKNSVTDLEAKRSLDFNWSDKY